MSIIYSKVVMGMLVGMLALAMIKEASATRICNMDSNKLTLCLPAVRGRYPPPPSRKCCSLIWHADLRCLCRYKSVLPSFGIDPLHAMALPKKCGIRGAPVC